MSVTSTSHIIWLNGLTSENISEVGRSYARLKEISQTFEKGIELPSAFLIKSSLFDTLKSNEDFQEKWKHASKDLIRASGERKIKVLKSLKDSFLKLSLPKDFQKEFVSAYKKIGSKGVVKISTEFFVDEYSFTASFYDFYSLRSEKDIVQTLKKSLSNFFTLQVFHEKDQKSLDERKIKLTLKVEEATPAQASGKLFTFERNSGFSQVVTLESNLGNFIADTTYADSFLVWKEISNQENKHAIVSRTKGEKRQKLCITKQSAKMMATTKDEQESFSLSEQDIQSLTGQAVKIEKQQGAVELHWEKRGNKIIILNVLPHTVVTQSREEETYELKKKSKVLFEGTALNSKINSGKICILEKERDLLHFQPGQILLVKEIIPGIRECVKKASGIIFEGSKDSSLAALAREIGIAGVVEAQEAWKKIKSKALVTLADGKVYEGALPFEAYKKTSASPKTKTKIMMNIVSPENAFELSQMPHDGVGLVRFEDIFAENLKVHPLALLYYPKIKERKTKAFIEKMIVGYKDKKEFAVEKLAEGIAKIAVAFYPQPVTVRLTNFESSEFQSLLGAKEFEAMKSLFLFDKTVEDAVTLKYREAFGLQCQAIKKARNEWNLKNIIVMAPFCPTPEQADQVMQLMEQNGLKKGENGLQIHGMCEIPSNVVLANEFAKIFDGFSIDTKKLLEHTFGVKSEQGNTYTENSAAVKSLVQDVIRVAHKNKKTIGYCGSTASDSNEFAQFLIQQGIDSVSFSADKIVEMKEHTAALEKTVGRTGNKTHKGFLSLVVSLGAVAAMLIGMGSGCSETLDRKVEEVKQVSEYVPPAKIREELEKNFKEQVQKITEEAKVKFEEKGFAQFNFSYPISWSMQHEGQSITINGSSPTEYVRIFVRSTPLLGESASSTIQIAGREARQGENVTLSDRVAPRLIEIPLTDNKILVLEGGGDQFEKIVQTIQLTE